MKYGIFENGVPVVPTILELNFWWANAPYFLSCGWYDPVLPTSQDADGYYYWEVIRLPPGGIESYAYEYGVSPVFEISARHNEQWYFKKDMDDVPIAVATPDLNHDGRVNHSDRIRFTQALGDGYHTFIDLNGGGTINLTDMIRFSVEIGHNCPWADKSADESAESRRWGDVKSMYR